MLTNRIPAIVQSGCRAYSLLLFFYPYSLRCRFEQEMIAVFEDQVCHAWEQSGYSGVLRSWWRALAELLRIAFPARLESLKIPVLSLLLSLLVTALFFSNALPLGHCPK
jgi:hypothetical protein